MAVKTFGKGTMTLDDIKAIDRDYLVPREVAAVLGCTPYYISLTARDRPQELGFPTFRVGNRTKIPKAAFVHAMEGETEQAYTETQMYELFREFMEFVQEKGTRQQTKS